MSQAVERIRELTARASAAEIIGNLVEAEKLYLQTAGEALQLAETQPNLRQEFRNRAEQCMNQVEKFRSTQTTTPVTSQPPPPAYNPSPDKSLTGDGLVDLAIAGAGEAAQRGGEAEARGQITAASEIYEAQVEGLLGLLRANPSLPSEEINRIREAISILLDHLEALKSQHNSKDPTSTSSRPQSATASASAPPSHPFFSTPQSSNSIPNLNQNMNSLSVGLREPRGAPDAGPYGSGGGNLTEAEKEVLMVSSHIGGQVYLPWMASDASEDLMSQKEFTDPAGDLTLSHKQLRKFSSWKRPKEMIAQSAPRVVVQLNALAVTQRLVPNCSFVSSLCCCAAYEHRFKRQIITSRIFPKDASGAPVYNPSGKYMVKLHINGVERRVVVDDRLPTDRHGGMICAHSSTAGELWPSLLEKAFLKVHGGYDFGGSTSEVDMYMLTAWVPESVHVHAAPTASAPAVMSSSSIRGPRRMMDPAFNQEKVWARLRDGHHLGQVLISASTGKMSEEEQERMGLVETHAYAVLQVREVCGHRLLLLKNPWSEVRWKGPFCPEDTSSWTQQLRQALKYDSKRHSWIDNGIFWIDWRSFLCFFAKLHLNWNPHLFPHRNVLHFDWPLIQGQARKDTFSLGACPQFCLRVDNQDGAEAASVWVHLSKHVLKPTQENRDFIALHVFHPPEGPDCGKQVFYLEEAASTGTYINNPHILVRLDVPPRTARTSVLVLSQQDRVGPNTFTLRLYATKPITLRRIPNTMPFESPSLNGQWPKGGGGRPVSVELWVDKPLEVCLRMEAPKDYGVILDLLSCERDIKNLVSRGKRVFRPGFCYLRFKFDTAGKYLVQLANYEKAENVPFVLRCGSTTCPVRMNLST